VKVPRHVAIIMDGNGRWAKAKGRPRSYGHVKGSRVAKKIIRAADDLGIKYLTLYTFSSENWRRPKDEVGFLMRLLKKYLQRERAEMVRENVLFRFIGDVERFPEFIVEEIRKTMAATKNNTGLNLVLALNYGARNEIVDAVKEVGRLILEKKLTPESIDSETFSRHLGSSFMPDPELIIRTSGENRLSNFLLWQAAYSEFYITPTLWPDFTKNDLSQALEVYKKRERRFGGISAAPQEIHV
jgi:undecaprenyl diphosphate synthase